MSRRLKKKLERDFGQAPDRHYYAGDMDRIRDYFGYRRDKELDDFLVDSITSGDLDIDTVFKKVNNCQSSSGEQYLYYMLRSPCVSSESWEKRRKIIGFVEENPSHRLDAQLILARLGRSREVNVTDSFAPQSRSPLMLIGYVALLLLFIIAVGMLVTGLTDPDSIRPLWFFALFINPLAHTFFSRKIAVDIATVNYSARMLIAAGKIKKLLAGELNEQFSPMYEAARELKSIKLLGGVDVSYSRGDISELINAFLLLDLISYEYIKNKIGKYHGEIFAVHEHIGMLDSAISIASYRKCVKEYCEPDIDFSGTKAASMSCDGLRHPLIDSPVPNSVHLDRSALVTGSNTSGKSTYLKTAALNAIMSQGICTCLGSGYKASAFRIFSSIAISDNLLAGESYYISEIRSLKRILDYAENGFDIFCVIDEVLRGTNTIERVAASSEVLRVIADKGVICVAATHDLELCSLLSDSFDMFHFEERVDGEEMTFDYKLRDGPAVSRNAIKLLSLMGFEDELVKNADERAQNYISTGTWTM